jgi:hypothetical protein
MLPYWVASVSDAFTFQAVTKKVVQNLSSMFTELPVLTIEERTALALQRELQRFRGHEEWYEGKESVEVSRVHSCVKDVRYMLRILGNVVEIVGVIEGPESSSGAIVQASRARQARASGEKESRAKLSRRDRHDGSNPGQARFSPRCAVS